MQLGVAKFQNYTAECSKNGEKRRRFRTCELIFGVAGALPKGKIILLAALMRASCALRRISALALRYAELVE